MNGITPKAKEKAVKNVSNMAIKCRRPAAKIGKSPSNLGKGPSK
jgi:hypothetical protein